MPRSNNNDSRANSLDVTTVELHQGREIVGPYAPFGHSQLIEDSAVAHFMLSYVPGSNFDYLQDMYGHPSAGNLLPATVHAASMASLAHELRQAKIMEMARRTYATALIQTNSALADPATATNDATLISVLLLSLFEAMVWARPRTPSSWMAHTQGAFALIKLRGSQQFKTIVGRRLFMQVARIVCINAVQQKTRLPPEVVPLVKILMKYVCGCPKYELTFLVDGVTNLIADVGEDRLTAEEIVETAIRLDKEYVSYLKSFPPVWRYQKIALEKPHPDVYGKTIYQYTSHRLAQVWNTCRMTRILINEAIYYHSLDLPLHSDNTLRERAAKNINQMAIDIAATVPPIMNPSKFPSPLDRPALCSPTCDALTHFDYLSPKARIASLLWPLSSIRGASLASDGVRAYAVERLKDLVREFRVPQVQKVAQETREFNALQDGLHMFYVS